mgnify:CR=1 FL=1
MELEGFRFFPRRRLALSVATHPIRGLSEDQLALALAASRRQAREQLDGEDFEIERFLLTKANGEITLEPQDASASSKVTAGTLREISAGLQEVSEGTTAGDAFHSVILGGVLGPDGNLEGHGRWLPYPMLVPMMLGTAMFVETGYLDTGSDPGYELGNLSSGMLQGDLASKERLRVAYWSIYQLASRLNWGQMAELLDSCPNLQAIDDMAALVRLTAAQSMELKSRLKRLAQKEDNESAAEIKSLQRLLEEAQKDFDLDFATVYAAALLSDDPSAVLRYIQDYPVSGSDREERALADLRFAMTKGSAGLDYLLQLGLPVYESELGP